MNPKTNRRLLIAAITAPLVGIASLLVLVTGVYAPLSEITGPELADGVGHALVFFVLFGAPGAYVVEALIGVPAYRILRPSGRLTFPVVVGLGTLGGVIAFAVPWTVVWGTFFRPGDLISAVVAGAVGGALAGAWFWLVAFGAGVTDSS